MQYSSYLLSKYLGDLLPGLLERPKRQTVSTTIAAFTTTIETRVEENHFQLIYKFVPVWKRELFDGRVT